MFIRGFETIHRMFGISSHCLLLVFKFTTQPDSLQTDLMCLCRTIRDTLTDTLAQKYLTRLRSNTTLTNLLYKAMHKLAFWFRLRTTYPDTPIRSTFIETVTGVMRDYESQSLQYVFGGRREPQRELRIRRQKELRRQVWTLLLRKITPDVDNSERDYSIYPLHDSGCSYIFVTIFDAFWITGHLLSIKPIMTIRLGVTPNICTGNYTYWNTLFAYYELEDVMEIVDERYEWVKQEKTRKKEKKTREKKRTRSEGTGA